MAAAGADIRKRKKLEDDFTPSVEATLAGLTGTTCREVSVCVSYAIDGEGGYQSEIGMLPSQRMITRMPQTAACAKQTPGT